MADPGGSVARTAGLGIAGPPETGGLIPLASTGATREPKGEGHPAFFGVSAVLGDK